MPEYGYDVKVTRDDHYDGLGVDTTWLVMARRLSDDVTLTRRFEWAWTARRFARSCRRLGKAFRSKEHRVRALHRRYVVDLDNFETYEVRDARR